MATLKILEAKPVSEALPAFGYNYYVGQATNIKFTDDLDGITVHDGKSVPYYLFIRKQQTCQEDIYEVLDTFDKVMDIFDFPKDDHNVILDYLLSLSKGTIQLLSYQIDGSNDTGYLFYNTINEEQFKTFNELDSIEDMPDEEKELRKQEWERNHREDLSLARHNNYILAVFARFMEVVQKRYNVLNFNNKVDDIVEIIKTCRYMDDNGEKRTLNIAGVENLFSTIKEKLFIREI